MKGGENMTKNNTFLDAQAIVELTGMSEAYAYKLIKQLNDELQEKGFITIRGRISKQYFEERVYGLKNEGENASI